MTKSAKRNIIISAILAIIMCASLITGATFALFTSDSKVNIAVTSGKVSVIATVDNLQTYSGSELTGDVTADENKIKPVTDLGEYDNGTFVNGGTAEFNSEDANTLELTNMTPGDKVTFDIIVKNYSNVKVKYRTKIAVNSDTGLFAGLKFNIGGMTLKSSTAWKYLDPVTDPEYEPVATYTCSVELPSDKGNEYQEKSCNISYIVEAIQSNAATTEEAVSASAEGNLIVSQEDTTVNATVKTTQSLSDSTMTVTYPAGTLLNTSEVSTGDDDVKKTAVTQSLEFESYSASTELSNAGVEILGGQAVAQYDLTLPVAEENTELVTVTINYT